MEYNSWRNLGGSKEQDVFKKLRYLFKKAPFLFLKARCLFGKARYLFGKALALFFKCPCLLGVHFTHTYAWADTYVRVGLHVRPYKPTHIYVKSLIFLVKKNWIYFLIQKNNVPLRHVKNSTIGFGVVNNLFWHNRLFFSLLSDKSFREWFLYYYNLKF